MGLPWGLGFAQASEQASLGHLEIFYGPLAESCFLEEIARKASYYQICQAFSDFGCFTSEYRNTLFRLQGNKGDNRVKFGAVLLKS